MSMPTSAIAATARGVELAAGSEPPEQHADPVAAEVPQPARAICERPALWTHRNSTAGHPVAGQEGPSKGLGGADGRSAP